MGQSNELEREAPEDAYLTAGNSGLVDEAALFASPLPMVGEQKTTTRKELWVSCYLALPV